MRKLLSVLAAAGLLLSFGAPVVAAELPKTYAQQLATTNAADPFSWFSGLFSEPALTELAFDSAALNELPADCRMAAANQLPANYCASTEYLVAFDSSKRAELEKLFNQDVLEVFELGASAAVLRLDAAGLKLAASLPWVSAIEANQTIALQQTQNNAPWSIDRLDQPALPLSGTFTSTNQGAGVKIYIMDTGISTSHSDFAGRLTAGYSFYSDGNGSNDCNGHGTHVAGSAAGTIYGAAKQATVIPVRVMNCEGSGTVFSVMAGLNWVAQNTFVGEPAVVNMSLGGAVNSTLDEAITSLSQQGLLFVVAAGNDNQNACNYSPARVPLAITIAASNINDQWPSNPAFSNFGSCVDLIAPGVDIVSAFIGGPNSSARASGTSMAAGITSGVAAIQMTNGHQTPQAIDSALKSMAVSGVITGVPAGTSNLLIQSKNFFETAQSTPDPANTLDGPAAGGDNTEVTVPPVTDPAPAPAPEPVGKVNVGSFNGKLVVYALGLDGARISWKVAGRWGVANAVGNTLNRFDRPVGAAGRDVIVEIYVDRVLRMTKVVRTR
jgi:subtilisin family serine protease